MAGYLYTVVREPAGFGVVDRLRREPSWLALAGGPGIGFASDEYPLIVSVEAGQPPPALPASAGPVERLSPTVRPTGPEPPHLDGGMVALRRFEVDPADASEVVELSAAAWPAFENAYDARILGFFSVEETGGSEFLLVTWYRSLAEWERSRGTLQAELGDVAEAGRRFRRRHELTRRTIVRIGVPLTSYSDTTSR